MPEPAGAMRTRLEVVVVTKSTAAACSVDRLVISGGGVDGVVDREMFMVFGFLG